MTETRQIECQFDIEADPGQVWEALTQAEHVVRWFAPHAESETGPDGYVKLGWRTPDIMLDLEFTRWVENELLETTWHSGPSGQPAINLPLSISLTPAPSGGTTLRLVHSGFLSDASWDDEFNSHSRGWNIELRFLKHYLEQELGKTRAIMQRIVELPIAAAVMDQLVGAEGIFQTDASALNSDKRFDLTLPDGTTTSARILYRLASSDLVVICDALQQGALRLSIESYAGNPELWLWAMSWQMAEDELLAVVEPWFDAIQQKLGADRQSAQQQVS